MNSIYIHIPFCRKKCAYCDFVSYAGKEGLIDEYINALIKEIHNSSFGTCPERNRGIRNSELRTVFFGGGTPTLLEPRHFDKIISTIICHLTFDIGHSELSVEANPGTANKAKLKALRRLGINRLSIGVQSFNDRHLKTLGRIHDAKTARKFYEDARSAGFDNINLDLIFALPGQTLEEWKTDLQTAIDLGPDHLSTYNLQIEEGTPLWRMIKLQASNNKQCQSTKFQLPNEDEELAMYEYTIETLTAAGYKHYEISNFAKPGRECLHNVNYWKNGNYIGIGAGAHSHVNGKRWANPNCIQGYVKSVTVTKPVSSFGYEVRDEQRESGIDTGIVTDQRETIFMGLRLLDGLPSKEFNGFEKEVTELIKDGLLEENNGNYRLTHHGLLLGNLVFEKFV